MLIKLSRVMRKPEFCQSEDKGADQLCSSCTPNQRLCFRYLDSIIPLLPKSKISSFKSFSDLVGNPEDRFSCVKSKMKSVQHCARPWEFDLSWRKSLKKGETRFKKKIEEKKNIKGINKTEIRLFFKPILRTDRRLKPFTLRKHAHAIYRIFWL